MENKTSRWSKAVSFVVHCTAIAIVAYSFSCLGWKVGLGAVMFASLNQYIGGRDMYARHLKSAGIYTNIINNLLKKNKDIIEQAEKLTKDIEAILEKCKKAQTTKP